jgi:uncharacterized protein
MKPLETDLPHIAELAAARHDEFEVLRYTLELDDAVDDARLDALVEGIAAPIRAAIDCTQCANCCRLLDVYVTREDITRLAQGLNRPTKAVIAQYGDPQSLTREDEWRLRACPCPFLRGKLCGIYRHRPDACRNYPAFTPDFRWTLADTIEGARFCPIIYNVLSALVEQFDALYPAMIAKD